MSQVGQSRSCRGRAPDVASPHEHHNLPCRGRTPRPPRARRPDRRPGDAGYDEARAVHNGMIDRHPAAIVRCASPQDVARAISFARAHDKRIAVRGGGHNGGGLGVADDAVVVDLAGLKDVVVDPGTETVLVGGGCTWAEVDKATGEHGRATPSGVISTTGVGGLTLGGGIGHLYPALRPDDRQPDRRRRRPGRRHARARERRRAPRAVLGAARRRRELRRRHDVPLPDAPGRLHRDRGPDDVADRADARGAALLPGLHPGRAPRRQRLLRDADGAAGARFPEELHLKKMCAIVWCLSACPTRRRRS